MQRCVQVELVTLAVHAPAVAPHNEVSTQGGLLLERGLLRLPITNTLAPIQTVHLISLESSSFPELMSS